MKQKYFNFSSHLSIFLIGLTCLFSSLSANSADYKFSFTSNTDGLLGYFTVNETIFNENVNSPNVGYLQNKFINDLSFIYRGYEYGVDDILISDQTVFDTFADSSLPKVSGGNGYLAGVIDMPLGIVILGDDVLMIGNAEDVTGFWTTSYVTPVPEPQSNMMLILGLLLLGLILRKHYKY